MKIIQFKDKNYGIVRKNYWNLLRGNLVNEYLNVALLLECGKFQDLDGRDSLSPSGFILRPDSQPKTQADIDAFERSLWKTFSSDTTSEIANSCKFKYSFKIRQLFIFIDNKEYTRYLTPLDLGTPI